MDLVEPLGEVFEIDVRAVTGAEHAQLSRRSRELIHQAPTMGAVPIPSVRRAAIHVVLRLPNPSSRLRRYRAMLGLLMVAQAAERTGEKCVLGRTAKIADPARVA